MRNLTCHADLRFLVLIATIATPLVVPREASGTAQFSRQYNTFCSTSHAPFPRLNDVGIAFKDSGFQFPEEDLSFIATPRTLMTMPAGEGNPVEADETFVGGEVKNMHKNRKLALRRVRNEVRDGDTRLIGKTTVLAFWTANSAKCGQWWSRTSSGYPASSDSQTSGARIEALYRRIPSYLGMTKEYTHQFVNQLNQYVDGQVHTNGIENF